MENEVWKDITWWEERYQVSNMWRVRSLDHYCNHSKWWIALKKWKIMKLNIRFWYAHVRFPWSQLFRVHRLVAQAFLWFNINRKDLVICHKNDIKNDNRIENLFIWTQSDNIRDCSAKWRLPSKKWENNNYARLTEEKVKWIKLKLKEWKLNYLEIWDMFWISRQTIWDIKRNRTWSFVKI